MAKQSQGSSNDRSLAAGKGSETVGKDRQHMAGTGRKGGEASGRNDDGSGKDNSHKLSSSSGMSSSGRSKNDDNS